MFRLGLILGGLAICNSILAILGPWYLVTRLGVNIETDAFFASSALPQFIFLIISSTLAFILVPLLTTKDEEAFLNDSWVFFLGVTIFFSLAAGALYLTIGAWVPVLVSGFSAAGKSLAIELTKVQLLSMVFNASIVTLWSSHQARHRFIWPELSQVAANVAGLLLLVYALPRFGIKAAAWAVVFSNGLKVVLLLPILGRWRWPNWRTRTLAETWRRLKPLLPGQSYLRADPLLDRYLTSMTHEGGLSLLYIGQQVFSTANQVIGKAIVSPMLPRLTIEVSEKDWESYRRAYRQRLLWILGLTVLGMLLLFFLGTTVLHLTIGHGGITSENVRTLWLIMLALAGLLVGGAAAQVTSVAFYAMGNTKTPTLLSVTVYTIFIPLKILIFLRYGLAGLAITTSLYFVTIFLIQFLTLEKAVQRQLGRAAGHAFAGRQGGEESHLSASRGLT